VPRICIVIPCFNERENIGELVQTILQLYADVGVLVVDDQSPDGTARIIRDLVPQYQGRLELLERQGKGGRGSAVLAGFVQCLQQPYEYFIEMDADFSHKPEEIALLLQKIQTCDIVIGSRYLPGSAIRNWGWKRTFFSALANRFARFVLRIPISDYTNGFRCYTRAAILALDMQAIDAKGYVVLSEVAYQFYKKHLLFGEVPTEFVNRRRGISNLTKHEVIEAFRSVLRIRWPQFFPQKQR
jgi:dolichol-phosphate mannosyltransferase